MNELDKQLLKLRDIQQQINFSEEVKEKLRAELLEMLKEEELKSYKSDIATITYVERKSIKIDDRERIVGHLLSNGLTNFLDLVPEVAEHYELNKDFDDRVKKGYLKIEGVEVTVTELPQIKFN